MFVLFINLIKLLLHPHRDTKKISFLEKSAGIIIVSLSCVCHIHKNMHVADPVIVSTNKLITTV